MYGADVDRKWQKKWAETDLYAFDEEKIDEKFYCLEMFSYPSGANLHLGHWYNFGLADIYARMKRMQGYNVFQPMGFDAFGLPAENYAIKTGKHPEDSTVESIETMTEQLQEMGAMFNWDYTISTADEKYYKWTQWLFLQLFKAGLAYREKAPVNWCPECKTVLANEQVVGGCCERCDTEVVQKELTQWFFKITEYADELVDMIDKLKWPERTKKVQKNWIGRSHGIEIIFDIANDDMANEDKVHDDIANEDKVYDDISREDILHEDIDIGDSEQNGIRVYTTRVDTLMGVTYIVIAPEHELVDEITTDKYRKAVEKFRKEIRHRTEVDRLSTGIEKEGAFTGAYCIHPITGEKLPIWIADYVLASYGTGCVMAVPAHDERDYVFARKYGLPVKQVIKSIEAGESSLREQNSEDLPFVEYGELINSGKYNGLKSKEAAERITAELESMKRGCSRKNYRLRDWLVSRQRYWGAPIPVVYCEHCGIVPVPEEELPVKLPYDVEFTPDGVSPLKKNDEFLYTVCPDCGGEARRETDTLDTFVDSSWYYLRYPDAGNEKRAFDSERINRMLPVDKYVGGPEHATMHLLYARFITKVLRDLDFLEFDEPFLSVVHQGIILGADGKKMSKSRPEFAVSPDEYIERNGSDVIRMSLVFSFAYSEGGSWSEKGLQAIVNFVNRIEIIIEKLLELRKAAGNFSRWKMAGVSEDEDMDENMEEIKDENIEELNHIRHNTIKSITYDAERFKFNTSIARLMEFLNGLETYINHTEINIIFLNDVVNDFVLLLAPFAPHFAEELWEKIDNQYSVFNQQWPVIDKEALVRDRIEIPVQINGRVRTRMVLPAGIEENSIKRRVLSNDEVKEIIRGREIRRMIIIPDRIVNIVV